MQKETNFLQMATKKEEIQYVWKGNNKEALNALAELESRNHDLLATIKDLKLQQEVLRLQDKKNSAEYKALGVQIADLTKQQKTATLAIVEQRKQVGLAGQSTSQLNKDYKELKKTLDTLTHGSDAYNKTLKDKLAIEKELGSRKAAQAPSVSMLDQLKGQMPAALAGGIAGGVVGIGIGVLSSIGDGIRRVIPPMKDLADENTNLQVALNLSDGELKELNAEIKRIDTRTSVKDLKAIGEVAGDLNVAKEETIGFVEETNKGAIVFKKSFASAEEYATSVGKLKGMYAEFKDAQYGDAINDIGSAMKVLEDDGPATAKSILDFTTRIGQLPPTLRPAIADTMALAAVLEEAGMTAEISSGGISNILLTATKNSGAFAKQLGMTKAEFTALLNSDPNGMLAKLAKSFDGLGNSQVGAVMKNLKIESQESVKVLGVLADNTDKLAAKQALSNQALAEGTRLTEIYNEKNNNFAGQVERIGKKMESIMNGILLPFRSAIEGITLGFGHLIGAFDEESKPIVDRYAQINQQVKNYDKNLLPLLKKYDELKAKSPEKNQEELRKVMNQIVGIMPQAVSKVDSYGRAIDINAEKVRNFVEELNKQNKAMGVSAEKAQENEAGNLKKQVDARFKILNQALKEGKNTIRIDDYKITAKGEVIDSYKTVSIEEYRKEFQVLKAEFDASFKKLIDIKKQVRGVVDKPATAKPENPLKTIDLTTDAEDKEANKKLNDKLKRIQDENAQILELEIDLAQQRYLAGLQEEERKILAIDLAASKKLIMLKNQFKDENGLVIEQDKWSEAQRKIYGYQKEQIEAETEQKITDIQKEFAKKREQQLLDEQAKAIEIANQTSLAIAQAKVEDATRSGDDLAVLNARFRLISVQSNNELAKLTETYNKRKRELDGNNEALLQLDENYYAESKNISEKYLNEQTALWANFWKTLKERKEKADIESLKLDVEESAGKGMQAQFSAKIALLDAEMAQELSVKNLTEQEKTNIVRKYAAERNQLEIQGIQQLSSKIVDYFGQAYGMFIQFQQTKVQNEIQDEDYLQKNRLANLEKQKERGQITAEQYTQRRTQLEEQHDKKTRQLQRKQAELNKQSQLVQATMGMAKAIVEVLATPWMIPIVSALGLAQIGVIASQKLPAYQEGGFTGQPNQMISPYRKPSATAQLAWVNEAGTEYIIPNNLLNQPAVANMVGIIEAMRTNKAYMNGGFTSTPTADIPSFSAPNSTAQSTVIMQMPPEMVEATKAIAMLYKNGVPTYFGGADWRRFHEDFQDYQDSNTQSGINPYQK